MPRILALCGSPLPNSRAQLLVDELSRQLVAAGAQIDTLAVHDLPAEALYLARFNDPAVQEAAARVAAADAVVIVSPVYKASFTGALKVLLDLLPQYALAGKVALPLMVGGSPAHLLTIDTQLRPVLCSMGPYHITQGVYFTDAQLVRQENGGLSIDPAVAPRLQAAVEDLMHSVRHRPGAQQGSIAGD